MVDCSEPVVHMGRGVHGCCYSWGIREPLDGGGICLGSHRGMHVMEVLLFTGVRAFSHIAGLPGGSVASGAALSF